MSRDPYSELPLTVECWVRLRNATARNDLLSSELVLSRGHWALFTAAENYLWLEPGETKRIPVNTTEGLTVEAWNQ